jgi:hypothetical protein
VSDGIAAWGEPGVETNTCYAGRRADGVVWVVIKNGAMVNEETSREMNLAIRKLAEHLPCRIVCDITAPHDTTSDGRRYGTSDETTEVTGRLALIVGSPVARMAGNAFMAARKPPYPTRLFTTEDAALAWLSDSDD